MNKNVFFFLIILYSVSCTPDYWDGDSEYDYMAKNGWKNEYMNIETSYEMINSRGNTYFKWFRNDSLIIEGYIQELFDNYAKPHETYSLALISNGYYTQFKKIELENNQLVLDTKWPRQSKDSLSMFKYERLEWY